MIRRTKLVQIRTTPPERTRWEECAAAVDMTLSEFVRHCIRIWIEAHESAAP